MPFLAPSNLQQGDRTTLTCTVARGDSPLTLMWKKDGLPLSLETLPSIKIINFDEFNSMLTIESLHKLHIGNYSCAALNSAGHSAVSTLINVQGTWKLMFLFLFSFSPTCISALQFRHDFLWLFSVLCSDIGSALACPLRADPRRPAGQLQLAQRRPIHGGTSSSCETSDHHSCRWLFQSFDHTQTRTRPCRQLHVLGLQRGWHRPLHCHPTRPRWLELPHKKILLYSRGNHAEFYAVTQYLAMKPKTCVASVAFYVLLRNTVLIRIGIFLVQSFFAGTCRYIRMYFCNAYQLLKTRPFPLFGWFYSHNGGLWTKF